MIAALKEKRDIGKKRFIKLSQAKWEEIEQVGLYYITNNSCLILSWDRKQISVLKVRGKERRQ